MPQSKATVAFLGVGNMGGRMVRRLLAAGHPVHFFDPSDSAAAMVIGLGAPRKASPADAAREAGIVLCSLPTPSIVEDAVTGPAGVLQGIQPGVTIVDMSTGDPATARRVAQACREAGANFLDAPVSRGVMGAENGTLVIMVGGDGEVLEEAKPVLANLGTDIMHVGPSGSGQVAKLCNNMLSAIHMQALGEVLVTGVKAGVDVKTLAEVIGASTGGSWVLNSYLPLTVLAGDTKTNFALDLMHKDVWLFMKAADELGLSTPVAAAAAQTYRIAKSEGLGGRDYSAIISFFEQLAKTQLVPQAAGKVEGQQ
ncbi:MAG: NAD(P)-dependent oxidoreductase [Candidatus Dormibacteraeota bacterium]|nr:NAD(P)-dependent oxidoreductase [Candidatus Dormibacteraeota bacterium]